MLKNSTKVILLPNGISNGVMDLILHAYETGNTELTRKAGFKKHASKIQRRLTYLKGGLNG